MVKVGRCLEFMKLFNLREKMRVKSVFLEGGYATSPFNLRFNFRRERIILSGGFGEKMCIRSGRSVTCPCIRLVARS